MRKCVILPLLFLFLIVVSCKEPHIEHTWDDGVITVFPSYLNDGQISYTCTFCGETKSESFIYLVGDIGPAGGYIFYDCDADNDNGNADGLISSVCQWRWMESCPQPYVAPVYRFGYYSTSGNTNLTVGTYPDIGKGISNTKKLVDAMGEAAYSTQSHNGTTSNYAAKLCDSKVITANGMTFDDWFLPSRYEMTRMYNVLKKTPNYSEYKSDIYISTRYWTSTESSSTNAIVRVFSDSSENNDYERSEGAGVFPARAF